jgi:hypothetical protein
MSTENITTCHFPQNPIEEQPRPGARDYYQTLKGFSNKKEIQHSKYPYHDLVIDLEVLKLASGPK